jgi:hypothetical protein
VVGTREAEEAGFQLEPWKSEGYPRVHRVHPNTLHINVFVSDKDGDQLVDFYWIDPMGERAR